LDNEALGVESADDGVGGAELEEVGRFCGTAEIGVFVSLTAALATGTASMFSLASFFSTIATPAASLSFLSIISTFN